MKVSTQYWLGSYNVIVYRPYDDTLARFYGYTIEVNIFQDFVALLYNLCIARYKDYTQCMLYTGSWMGSGKRK